MLLTRVKLKNYKSIARCSVPLSSLVFLVGPNGSGKSNFLDALRWVNEAVKTGHSPDLLDDKSISDENILAVVSRDGETCVAPISPSGRGAIRDRLFTAGELLRLSQLEPDPLWLTSDS